MEPPPTSQTATTPSSFVRGAGTGEGEPALLVCGENADGRATRALESREEVSRAGTVPPRRGDDDLQRFDVVSAGEPRVAGDDVGGQRELAPADLAVPGDVGRQSEEPLLLAHRLDAVADVGDEQAGSVRAHVDDPDSHRAHCRRDPGWHRSERSGARGAADTQLRSPLHLLLVIVRALALRGRQPAPQTVGPELP